MSTSKIKGIMKTERSIIFKGRQSILKTTKIKRRAKVTCEIIMITDYESYSMVKLYVCFINLF